MIFHDMSWYVITCNVNLGYAIMNPIRTRIRQKDLEALLTKMDFSFCGMPQSGMRLLKELLAELKTFLNLIMETKKVDEEMYDIWNEIRGKNYF